MRGNNNHGQSGGRSGSGSLTRRRVLVGAVAGTVALAGCSDDGTDEPADAGAGEGDGETESTGDEMDTETADEGMTETADEAATNQSYREAVRYENSVEITGTFEQDGRTTDIKGRFNGGNAYWRTEVDGQVSEIYMVDGDQYTVSDGECYRNTGQQGGSGGFDLGSFDSDTSELPDVTAEGTTTIEGETMLVYEFASEAASGFESEATYYVSRETGYLRRVESDSGTIDYHSWGSADPVSPPDMDCESY